MSEAETSRLNKGLKVFPTPDTRNIRRILLLNLNELPIKMRSRILFHTYHNGTKLRPLYINTNYNLGKISNTALENYFYATTLEAV